MESEPGSPSTVRTEAVVSHRAAWKLIGKRALASGGQNAIHNAGLSSRSLPGSSSPWALALQVFFPSTQDRLFEQESGVFAERANDARRG